MSSSKPQKIWQEKLTVGYGNFLSEPHKFKRFKPIKRKPCRGRSDYSHIHQEGLNCITHKMTQQAPWILSFFTPQNKRRTSSAAFNDFCKCLWFRTKHEKKKKFWLHRLSSSAGLVGKPSPQMFSPTKHCNFSIRTRRGRPLKARNSSTGVVCCPKHGWCQCKTLRPGERNLNQDRKHQIAFHWEQLQMLTTRSFFF